MSKPEIEAKIEYQEIIGEANKGGYQPIRFTRVKYKASNKTHIDIRRFQRAYDDEGEDVFHPTKIGFRFPEKEFARVIKEYTLMPNTYVHPLIIKKSFKLLSSGEFESAVLQAFKCIETKIRKKINADPEEIGVKLIRQAFNPDIGTLTDYNLPKSEREAFAHYIAGAFGFYKNPCSHRDVEINFISAFERIVVASDLLKLIDKSERKEN
ncbi:TIGR02391 family protein [Algoriphagus formosus]|uniref:TIGR02391 family protein n=1 Tax=Algoriphagus formosus TaxID=2007308 RepID=A0A4R5V8K3_9BACT|nr:TIGR02391 family protein [Algoriphagus aquimaris]TDK48241.1 TIGR02391 family protein [Algoriphagus aquimaris]